LSDIDPIDALEAETVRAGRFLAGLTVDDWMRPTRCSPLNVRELAVHALRGAYRILDTLAAPRREGEPEKDAVTYWSYDPAKVGRGVVERAKAESDERALDADIGAEWAEKWGEALAEARAAAADDPLVTAIPGTIRLRDFMKTRCIEVGVHTMDLRDALGLEPDPSRECLEAVGDVLRGILGADLRPMGMDDVRFALTGTGRASLTDTERSMLGPLADSFPLLQ
jgi:uncharacterized protein (TIGR03083 family)